MFESWIKYMTVIIFCGEFDITASRRMVNETLLENSEIQHNIHKRHIMGYGGIIDELTPLEIKILKRAHQDLSEFRDLGESVRRQKPLSRENERNNDTAICVIDVQLLNIKHPLIIQNNDHSKIIYPNNNGKIYFVRGQSVVFSCADKYYEVIRNHQWATWKCKQGTVFETKIENQDYVKSILELECTDHPNAIEYTYNTIREVTITERGEKVKLNVVPTEFYFNSDNKFRNRIPIFEVITESGKPNRIFQTKSFISRAIGSGQNIEGKSEIKFPNSPDIIHGRKNYKSENQDAAFEEQLISTQNEFCPGINRVVEMLLVNPTSMVYESFAKQTYKLMNLSPQWKEIYNNNWSGMIQIIEKIAQTRIEGVNVVTGVHEVLNVKNRDDTGYKTLFLEYELTEKKFTRETPIPLYYYKIVSDSNALPFRAGVVFVIVNNPYIEDVYSHRICEYPKFPTFHARSPAKWEPEKIEYGYSYTCGVRDFFDKNPYILRHESTRKIDIDFDVDSLLNSALQY